jgi:sulfate adenylyltransferase
MHYAHIELTKRAQEQLGAKLFLNPVVGPTKPGDIDYTTRMKCYDAIIDTYDKDAILLKTLPLAMRMGGPREAMLHAIIRQNYGATHFICGRDHAGPGSDSTGADIYGAFEARDFVGKLL